MAKKKKALKMTLNRHFQRFILGYNRSPGGILSVRKMFATLAFW